MNWDTGLHPGGEPDLAVVRCLRGMMRFPEAVEYAKTMRPEWWPGGFPRAFAAAVITDGPSDDIPGTFAWLAPLEQWPAPDSPDDAVRALKALSSWGMKREAARVRELHAQARDKWDKAEKKRDRLRARSWSLHSKAQTLELAAEDLVLSLGEGT
ncbi:MAG: hypothetical protein IT437_12665 [Phycisphaerales bacterium]|nr:hypothetical protein [Phycisphaerales bacterium]